MSSARLKLVALAVGGALALLSCAAPPPGGGKTSNGINLGMTGPHPVQPLPDKPRFGQAVSEADLAAWNIDIRTPDGKGTAAGARIGRRGPQGLRHEVPRVPWRRGERRYRLWRDGRRHRLVHDRQARGYAGQHVPVCADPLRLHPPLDADGCAADVEHQRSVRGVRLSAARERLAACGRERSIRRRSRRCACRTVTGSSSTTGRTCALSAA